MTTWTIRRATDRDRRSIIRIWHQGWHDAHHDLVPATILVYRKPEHFRLWLQDGIDETFVAESGGTLAGFYRTDAAELSKLYVRREARGSGLAPSLLAHAEQTLAGRGVGVAELYCTAGNLRAQRFYERRGWILTKTFEDALWCPEAGVDEHHVNTHRYVKTLIERGDGPCR